jgi:di/tricarboxylate transporter
MPLEGYIVVAVILLIIVALAKELMRPGLVFFSASVILMATGIINNEEMIAGFSNKGMITVGVLFLVSEGIRQSGMLNRLAQTYLPRKGKNGFSAAPNYAAGFGFVSFPEQYTGGNNFCPNY